jgi:hypothetical protein
MISAPAVVGVLFGLVQIDNWAAPARRRPDNNTKN